MTKNIAKVRQSVEHYERAEKFAEQARTQAIIAAYQHFSMAEVAYLLKISEGVVRKVLRSNACPIRPAHRRKAIVSDRTLIAAYESGKSLVAIALDAGIAPSTVANILAEKGCPLRPRGQKKLRVDGPALVRSYKRGKTIEELAEHHQCSWSSIRRLLAESNCEMRARGRPKLD